MIGIVPDGVFTVAVRTRKGHVTAPVIRNGYEAIAEDPVSVTFVTRAGGKATHHVVKLATVGV